MLCTHPPKRPTQLSLAPSRALPGHLPRRLEDWGAWAASRVHTLVMRPVRVSTTVDDGKFTRPLLTVILKAQASAVQERDPMLITALP